MGLKRRDCVRSRLKIRQCENPLGAVFANWETCQTPTSCRMNNPIKN